MKYELQRTVRARRDDVISLLFAPEYYSSWQPDLIEFKHVEGELGSIGSKSEHTNKIGNRQITMVETVVENSLPELYVVTYETKGGWNVVEHMFEELDDGTTLWKFRTEFRCSGIMWFMTQLMPGVFKKESAKYMNNFIKFAELQMSERNSE